ncbi:MAG: pilus (MSHA type) biogenesis protein MshL [Gammaproteobacteria bacterium]|nr:pilus (MSHA type) biogenesis protein MshL [Gammaproteobacteria bacterium]
MKYLVVICLLMGVVGCQSTQFGKDERMTVSGHLDETVPQPAPVADDIPPMVSQVPIVAPPKPQEKLQTFTVVATDLPARELLFALARDARLNLDIDPAITGNVSINAIDQTLPQILKRISRQVSLRYYIDGPNLVIAQDLPYMQVYRVDYLNMARSSSSIVSIATQIAATGTDTEGGGGGGGSNSSTDITNTTANDFWKSLEDNLAKISGGEVVSNRESGTMLVTATASAHALVQEFIDQVMSSARRQVLIEATVVEVTLNDDFQAGVDWSRIANNDGWNISQSTLGTTLNTSPFVSATYSDIDADRSITASIKALDTFGDVSVMSSPKIMAINNQTSILKVVDNKVYFTTEVEEKEATDNSPEKTTFTNTIHTVPVGFVMNVTPYITDNNEIILNIRPTISRILQFIDAPVPAGIATTATNRVPEIQVREMESVLRVTNGDTAVIGGLMQDSINQNSSGLPGLHEVDGFGLLFGKKERLAEKTELVIFLRPRIIDSASVNSDLADFKKYLKPRLLTE